MSQQGWKCPNCTYLNKPLRPGCSMCATPRPEGYQVPPHYNPSEEELKLLSEKEWINDESLQEIGKDWSCPRCTYDNKPLRPGCELCGIENPNMQETKYNSIVQQIDERNVEVADSGANMRAEFEHDEDEDKDRPDLKEGLGMILEGAGLVGKIIVEKSLVGIAELEKTVGKLKKKKTSINEKGELEEGSDDDDNNKNNQYDENELELRQALAISRTEEEQRKRLIQAQRHKVDHLPAEQGDERVAETLAKQDSIDQEVQLLIAAEGLPAHNQEVVERDDVHVHQIQEEMPRPREEARQQINLEALQMRSLTANDYELLHELEEQIGDAKEKGLTGEEINKIPTRKFAIRKGVKIDALCTICQEELEDGDKLRVLSCGDEFHVHCVDKWLQGNAVCPICKKMVKPKKLS